jgi:hypothetical protein
MVHSLRQPLHPLQHRPDSVGGTQWSSTSVSTSECDDEEEPQISEYDRLRQVVAAEPFETDAGTVETVALEVEGSSYLEWISEGLGVVGVSDDVDYSYPKRQLLSYELD